MSEEVEKKVEKVEKKGLKLPSRSSGLTAAQKEVLHLITEEFLTHKQIAQRRNCSLQAVYKISAQLKRKGALDGGFNKVEKVETTFNQSDIRLHGQEINIRIIMQNNKYQKLLQKSNTLFLEGNTIRLYKNSIEVYLGHSFYGKTINEAERHSLAYLQRFLARLEHDLKIGIIKNRSRNIKIVNQHFARGDSEIADNSIENKDRVWVYAEEDGKLAFITDNSFGFREDETLHPITGKQDREAVDKQVNDWRLRNPPTNSEIANNLNGTISVVNNLAATIGEYGEHIKSHTSAIKSLSKNMGKLVEIKAENIKLKKKLSQRKLSEFF